MFLFSSNEDFFTILGRELSSIWYVVGMAMANTTERMTKTGPRSLVMTTQIKGRCDRHQGENQKKRKKRKRPGDLHEKRGEKQAVKMRSHTAER